MVRLVVSTGQPAATGRGELRTSIDQATSGDQVSVDGATSSGRASVSLALASTRRPETIRRHQATSGDRASIGELRARVDHATRVELRISVDQAISGDQVSIGDPRANVDQATGGDRRRASVR